MACSALDLAYIGLLLHHANATDEFPAEARTALDRVRTIAERVHATVEGLSR